MIKLRQYQKDGVRAIYEFKGRALLADEQGLGKTAQSLSWILKIPKRRPVLIVTPSSVKYQWQDEGLLHFNIRGTVLEGTRPKMKELKDKIIILNYDILHYWLPVLLRNPPQVMIIDECQYVANPSAKRTKAVREIAQLAASVVALSGTPMTNKPTQLWSVLNIIRPDIFPDFSEFAWTYSSPRMTRYGWVYKGAKKKKQLFRILKKECMIRRLKKDVAKELPDKTHTMIPIKLGPKASLEYQKASNNFIGWLQRKSPARAMRAKKAQMLLKVGYLLRLCVKLRAKQTDDFIREFSEANPGKQLVGLTGHTEVIDRLRESFPDCVVVDGRVTGKLRIASVRRFTTRKIPYFWGNWMAAGTGLNLQTAYHFIVLDPPWTPGALLQGQDRVHRIGQKNKVEIFYPYAIGTIEEKWLKILRERTQDLKAILDGEKDLSENDMYGELLESIL